MKMFLIFALTTLLASCGSTSNSKAPDAQYLNSASSNGKFSMERNREAIVKATRDLSSTTKKALRKIGRKSMDETCGLTNSDVNCAAQKMKHEIQNKMDDLNITEGSGN